MTTRRTFRSRWVVRWGLLIGGACIAASVVLFLVAASASRTRGQTGVDCGDPTATGRGQGAVAECVADAGAGAYEDVKGVTAGAVLLALGIAQIIGAARIGITLAGPGIIVRNPLRTHRIRWSEIEGFGTDLGTAGTMSYGFGRVHLKDGRSVRIEAICAMPWEPKDHFADQRVIDALNEELAARQAEQTAQGESTD